MGGRHWRLARRYLPLLLLVSAQALVIGLLPSSSAHSSASASGLSGSAGVESYSGSGASGDRSHCIAGREFSTSIDFYAPPCTPGTVGGTYSNGGSTYPGVTNSTITVVDYTTDAGAVVDTILRAEGIYVSYNDSQEVDRAFQNFVNSHYVLWGRRLKLVTYKGTCQTVPPDFGCLEAEMDSIVQNLHPYAVIWGTSLCSACFARLAQDKTVVVGGVGFSDAFAQANAPYFWSPGESSTRIEEGFARFWCNQLTSRNSDRVVTFAQFKNPAQDFQGQKRVLGVISTNDPDNEDTVNNVLIPALERDCGDGGSIAQHHYFYSQDLRTAAQQLEAAVSTMDTQSDPATDVLCLCDEVAPELIYGSEQQSNYWPENLLADTQGNGIDDVAQGYVASPTQESLGCPNPQQGCEFSSAFGLLSSGPQGPGDKEPGPVVYRLGGGKSLPMQAYIATGDWEDLNMLASLIENTGPDLTPARMAAVAPSMGTVGGGTSGQAEVGFAKGSYNWVNDARVAYWSESTVSPYNGKPGTWLEVEGSRFLPNQYPTLSEPPIPIPVRS